MFAKQAFAVFGLLSANTRPAIVSFRTVAQLGEFQSAQHFGNWQQVIDLENMRSRESGQLGTTRITLRRQSLGETAELIDRDARQRPRQSTVDSSFSRAAISGP